MLGLGLGLGFWSGQVGREGSYRGTHLWVCEAGGATSPAPKHNPNLAGFTTLIPPLTCPESRWPTRGLAAAPAIRVKLGLG